MTAAATDFSIVPTHGAADFLIACNKSPRPNIGSGGGFFVYF